MSADDRIAIVAGLRTPFAKQSTVLAPFAAHQLGAMVVRELIRRTGIAGDAIELLVYGSVAPDLTGPNIAREIVLEAGLPPATDAHSVSKACTTSYQTTIDLARAIAAGDVDVGIAGGADSASQVPISVSKPLARALVDQSRARSVAGRLAAFRGIKPRDLIPLWPSLVDRSTGMTMGESAEKMARENGIGRDEQDAFAHLSHQRAAAAWADGRLAGEVMPVELPDRDRPATRDNMVRTDSELAAYRALAPVFGDGGTITAATSSPLSDGASAILMMRAGVARALGLPALGYLVSYGLAAVDPGGQMLIGPALAAPIALDRAGMTLADMDLIDLHEAFAAQVLSVVQAFERDLGPVDRDRLNVTGGSLAIGHPFAATGTRQITQTLRELGRRGGGHALIAACAAGGLGAALVVEAPAP
jgi:acetyl-CoA acyltransferase